MILLPILILLFATNPLYYAYKFDISGLKPESVTKLEKYRLEHYCQNSNFTYSGNHNIVLKRILIPYLLEINIGEVNIGKYDQFDLPEHKMTITNYNKDGTIKSVNEFSHVMYEVKENSLIKKEYTDSGYVERDGYEY